MCVYLAYKGNILFFFSDISHWHSVHNSVTVYALLGSHFIYHLENKTKKKVENTAFISSVYTKVGYLKTGFLHPNDLFSFCLWRMST